MKFVRLVGQATAKLAGVLNITTKKKLLDKNAKSKNKSKVQKLTRDDRLLLLQQAKWVEKLKLPGYDLSFRIRSKTEFSRVRKFKETWTLDWINAIPKGSVLWDVGANIGIMTVVAAQRPEINRVVAIEPFFMNYSAILENLVLNGLSKEAIVFCGGLGEKTSFIPLKLQNMIEGGALHTFGDIFKMGSRSTQPIGEQSCLCYAVDDLVKIEGMPFPTHMKIDIDGFELSMLKGAHKTLSDKRLVGIQVETMDHDDDTPQKRAVVSLLEDHGFKFDNEVVHISDKAKVYDLRFVR